MDFSSVKLKPVPKPTTATQASGTDTGASRYGVITEEERQEYFDTEEELEKKVTRLAELIKSAKHFVIYTGAGISTSANLPDFRSPNGIWTKLSDGQNAPKSPQLGDVQPTLAHMAIAKLVEVGYCKFVVTTNLDSLHLRSGISQNLLAELHGNAFKKSCFVCHKYWYCIPGMTEDEAFEKIAKGVCPQCGNNELNWTNVDFGQGLPTSEINKGDKHATQSDLALVLGSSMRVQPACSMPTQTYRYNRGHMVICNLQKTPFDNKATLVLHGKTDHVMSLLMKQLAIAFPDTPPNTIQITNGVYADELWL